MDMRQRRKFYRGVLNHVYQRTIGGEQLFYTIEDCLVFYTIFAVCAKARKITVIQMCIMHNHLHFLSRTNTVQELSDFNDHWSSWFVGEYNRYVGRTRKLLKKNFGSAPKWEDKRVRSCIIYIGNNPVEKQFCRRAADSRWNFLAYINSPNPYSDPIVIRKVSYALRKALKQVDISVNLNLPIKYAQLNRMFAKLTEGEKQQLIDYIITSYWPFDNEELLSYFKSYDSMLAAMDSTTGDDYDINEARDNFSLGAFREMMRYLEMRYPRARIREVTVLPLDEKVKLYNELRHHTSASHVQICNFLHLKAVKR